MIKVGLIGCGKIADSHAWAIQGIDDCEIVGVCDREPLMAKQLYQRFPVRAHFSDVATFLKEARPDVVHITTPPQTHFELGMLCLRNGCHVYIEKPFTCNTREAEELLAMADQKALKVTVGHDDQFRHAARRMRAVVRSGYLGESPLHMESYYGYEIASAGYAKALLGDRKHWVRSLPGGLLQNIISHGIARISEWLPSGNPYVIAHGFTSPFLRSLGERDIVDEVRVIISDESNTAYFTFSSQLRPCLHQFRMLGSRNGLLLDQDHETLIRLPGARRKSYLEQFVPPLVFARQYVGNVVTNGKTFLANDFHAKAGMRYLIKEFYGAIRDASPLPIPHREILLTSRIMDSIFSQLNERRSIAHESQ